MIMTQVLASKVDKADFNKIAIQKANKYEFENLFDSLQTLNLNVKQMCVLMNESVRIQMARGNDTEQLKEDRFVVLLEQMNFL